MKHLSLVVLGAAIALGGCATTNQGNNAQADLQQQLNQTQQQNSQLQSQNARLQQQLSSAEQNQQASQTSSSSNSMGDAISLVPPNAKPGECFARVVTPAKFKTSQQRILKSAASKKVETIPAKYKWTTKRILVQEASKKLVSVPATYKTTKQRVMVSPAHTKWVPGHGNNERLDPITGQTVCLIKVPAKYKTVTKREVATPAHTKTIEIPAKYKTIKVRALVSGPKTHTIKIPAKYQTVSQTKKVKDSQVVWSRVVCDRNATKDLIHTVQTKLKKQGYNPGPLDGLLGPLTMRGVRAYDKDNGLAYSKARVITYATLDSLDIPAPKS